MKPKHDPTATSRSPDPQGSGASVGSVIQVETIRLHDGSRMDVIRDIDKVMRLGNEAERLRTALNEIRCMAERYNYVGWQRIVGCMQKCADEALSPNT